MDQRISLEDSRRAGQICYVLDTRSRAHSLLSWSSVTQPFRGWVLGPGLGGLFASTAALPRQGPSSLGNGTLSQSQLTRSQHGPPSPPLSHPWSSGTGGYPSHCCMEDPRERPPSPMGLGSRAGRATHLSDWERRVCSLGKDRGARFRSVWWGWRGGGLGAGRGSKAEPAPPPSLVNRCNAPRLFLVRTGKDTKVHRRAVSMWLLATLSLLSVLDVQPTAQHCVNVGRIEAISHWASGANLQALFSNVRRTQPSLGPPSP